jgi:hypothetical protein
MSFSTAGEVGGGGKGLGEILKGSEPKRGRGLGTRSMATTCVCIFITCVYVYVTMCMYTHVVAMDLVPNPLRCFGSEPLRISPNPFPPPPTSPAVEKDIPTVSSKMNLRL